MKLGIRSIVVMAVGIASAGCVGGEETLPCQASGALTSASQHNWSMQGCVELAYHPSLQPWAAEIRASAEQWRNVACGELCIGEVTESAEPPKRGIYLVDEDYGRQPTESSFSTIAYDQTTGQIVAGSVVLTNDELRNPELSFRLLRSLGRSLGLETEDLAVFTEGSVLPPEVAEAYCGRYGPQGSAKTCDPLKEAPEDLKL